MIRQLHDYSHTALPGCSSFLSPRGLCVGQTTHGNRGVNTDLTAEKRRFYREFWPKFYPDTAGLSTAYVQGTPLPEQRLVKFRNVQVVFHKECS
jgi:hypothetical protein